MSTIHYIIATLTGMVGKVWVLLSEFVLVK